MLGKSAAAMIVSAALAMPAGAADLFVLSAFANWDPISRGCHVDVILHNYSGKTVESYAATVSLRDSSNVSTGTKPLRFEYVDVRGRGSARLAFQERCQDLPRMKVRAVERCILDGVRYSDCLPLTTVQVSEVTDFPFTFER